MKFRSTGLRCAVVLSAVLTFANLARASSSSGLCTVVPGNNLTFPASLGFMYATVFLDPPSGEVNGSECTTLTFTNLTLTASPIDWFFTDLSSSGPIGDVITIANNSLSQLVVCVESDPFAANDSTVDCPVPMGAVSQSFVETTGFQSMSPTVSAMLAGGQTAQVNVLLVSDDPNTDTINSFSDQLIVTISPEPGTLFLMAFGALAAGSQLRKRSGRLSSLGRLPNTRSHSGDVTP